MHLDRLDHSSGDLALLAEPSVLLIEDDRDLAYTERRFIERAGMRTEWASTGAEALRLIESFRPDVVLVDLGLPDMDGGKLIGWLAGKRAARLGEGRPGEGRVGEGHLAEVGIIVVSGSGEEVERIVNLELGADDYITKPASLRELVARIRAVYRRLPRTQPTPTGFGAASGHLMLGSARVDLQHRTVTGRGAAPIHLTTAEFEALEAMVRAAPQPVSREHLCRLALRRPYHAEDRGVDQLILNLRRKLFDDDSAHSVIVSVRGAGYAIIVERSESQ